MRVVFLTLLLGLVAGPHTLELAVEGSPAAVEILFDGEPVARLHGPPWVAALDFGPDPLPCEVVARALDARGHELGRAVQRVNLPHERESLDLLIERDAAGFANAARLVWQSASGEPARGLKLRLDGRPLGLRGDRATLPRLDPAAAHVLEATAVSSTGVRSAALLTGGAYGDRVATELVAVPLRLDGRPAEVEAARCLAGPDGGAVELQSLDEGSPELFVVASRESRYALRRTMLEEFPHRRGSYDPSPQVLRLPLPRRSRATFYWPEIPPDYRELADSRRSEIFLHSPPMELSSQGLWERILRLEPKPNLPTATPRLADVVGVAVMAAAGTGRPRAVLVAVHPDEPDPSQFRPEQIRRLARSLHVPLHVWSVGATPATAWSETRAVAGSSRAVLDAHWALQEDLESQRIAWVRGATPLHLFSVRPDCAAVALAN